MAWIREILGYNTEWNALLIGMGIPLTGIGNYQGLLPPGFKIAVVADLDKNNHGSIISGLNLTVQPMKNDSAMFTYF
ncbi:hypothetical protein SPSIL_032950 [Sporomusa silvacetica DSM 10669]|uniref:Uncharacterized protein n=1 Tax=Sporomusa silvacetica DSM 10669 TaxID=1123289 RepID=A0ABZ3IN72_9FIRM|nr:redox-sensing transcriptional repressor Rex [Sporomusa silvacetica DSM 10669]